MAREQGPAPEIAPGSPFVGRREEMRQLGIALNESISGRGGVVLLAGEPGMGKTRTAQELADHARRIGVRVLVGRCHEGEGAPAYWPWIQIVRAYAEDSDPSTLGSEMGRRAADVAQLGDRLAGSVVPPSVESAQARFLLFDSLATFFKNAARSRPLMLLLDDLHCADAASLLLLQFLSRENGDAPLLIIGTYRDTDAWGPGAVEETIAELARQPHAWRLQLRGLDEDDVARLMEWITGNPPARALVARVHEETGGNPFFVTEVVRLLDSGEGRALEGGFVPSQGVQEIIGRRLRRLSAECNEVLTVAAVLGREFDIAALRKQHLDNGVPLFVLLRDCLLAAVESLGHERAFPHKE